MKQQANEQLEEKKVNALKKLTAYTQNDKALIKAN